MRAEKLLLSLAAGAYLTLSGCAAGLGAAAVGAGAAAVSMAQERSVGAAIDDNAIAAQVSTKLISYSAGAYANTGIEVSESRVMLAGVVKSLEDKRRLGELVWEVGGVREVLNELQVDPGGGALSYATDVRIANQLRARLTTDAQIRSINFAHETVNGVVYLIGVARTPQELKRVVTHASTIYGVGQVVSHILLKDDPRRHRAPVS